MVEYDSGQNCFLKNVQAIWKWSILFLSLLDCPIYYSHLLNKKERGCVPLDQDEPNVNNQRHCMPIYRVPTILLPHTDRKASKEENDGQCNQARIDNVRRNWKKKKTRQGNRDPENNELCLLLQMLCATIPSQIRFSILLSLSTQKD